jgi:asparagine synthase (glutamine-hydrolysing)
MTDSLALRGPDDRDVWLGDDGHVALGHRRLAIIDLSAEGHQPMRSATSRFVITFNGEIYNYLDLRAQLTALGATFRGHSDTEVLLAAFEAWGVEQTLPRLNGMFAFGVWDSRERSLTLARDRFGEKPLYYGWVGGAFVFASQLTAIRSLPGFDGSVDRAALASFLRFGYVPSPRSIYGSIRKLPAAASLRVTPGSTPGSNPEERAYWALRDVVTNRAPFEDERAAVDQLDALLRDSVKLRLMSDVPIGAFLSGGIDSSTIVAMMQAESSRRVSTFSIANEEREYQEGDEARAVARHLGTDHHELLVTGADALGLVARLPEFFDEPFGDVSQIPTFLVSQFARRNVTVALSGDAGDELFLGYNRHVWLPRIWNLAKRLPLGARRVASTTLLSRPPTWWDARLATLSKVLPAAEQRLAGEKLHKIAGVLGLSSSGEMFRRLCSQWESPTELVIRGTEPTSLHTEPSLATEVPDLTERMAYVDTLTYLPDDILAKVDRASMASSLEARAPYLDPRVVEFAWRLPKGLKIRDGVGKWILRQVLARYVPPSLTERPKSGFGVPLDTWLRGPLRELAEEFLSEARLRREGYLNPAPIRAAWSEHLGGRRNHQYRIWCVLMFQMWLESVRA